MSVVNQQIRGLAVCLFLALTAVAFAHAPSGAIFTTLADGSEVNFNIYSSKDDVYLDGGPGPGAPQSAAGLDDGIYVFQVTDPSGKTLLSTDNAQCRQFTVTGGVITSVGSEDLNVCPHATGIDLDHGSVTVQLMPYNNTPNPGGVYKVWITSVSDFPANCLRQVGCNGKRGGTVHGFSPAHSKTDNFKVKNPIPVEIDSRFFYDTNQNGHKDETEPWVDGLGITWTDTLNATNKKWSYYAPGLNIFHEAHVEAVESGIHKITIADQPGCKAGLVHVDNVDQGVGPQTLSIMVPQNTATSTLTIFVDIACVVGP
jgi:hypothetical protein